MGKRKRDASLVSAIHDMLVWSIAARAILQLDAGGQQRVVRWLVSRFGDAA